MLVGFGLGVLVTTLFFAVALKWANEHIGPRF
jgi:hypothetical protein